MALVLSISPPFSKALVLLGLFTESDSRRNISDLSYSEDAAASSDAIKGRFATTVACERVDSVRTSLNG